MQSIGLKYGGIAGLVYVAFSLVGTLMQGDGTPSMATGLITWALAWGITFFLVYTACKTYRDEVNGGAFNIGAGIKMALLISVIAGLIVGAYSIINTLVIDPGAVDTAVETAREQWEAQNMSEEQMETAEKWTRSMAGPAFAIPISIIFLALGGLIKGLISGAILAQEKDPLENIA